MKILSFGIGMKIFRLNVNTLFEKQLHFYTFWKSVTLLEIKYHKNKIA